MHLPDTGHIILTLEDEGGDGACPTAPSMWEKTVAAMSRIRSLQLSLTKLQHLTPHLVNRRPCEDVWATM